MAEQTLPAIGPHITAFYAENIKKLRVVRITPDGSVIQITGANGSGKSSVLDAIFWALGGTKGVDAEPIRRGEQSAVIELSLGPVTVTRKFSASGSTLTLRTASGARYPSPQSILDDLVGTLSFDPLAFDRMPSKQRLEELRRIAPLPVEVDVLDNQNRVDFEARTDVNRALRDAEGELAGTQRPDAAVLALPATSPEDALRRMQEAGEINARRAQRSEEVLRLIRERELQEGAAQQRREQAARFLAEAEELDARAAETQQSIALLPPTESPIDTAALAAELAVAQETNRRITREQEKQRAVAVLEAKVATLRATSEGLTTAMAASTARRTALIAAAVMPIEGLTYGAGDVLFGGLPFDQASSAERMRVSMAIAMAGKPKLRVLRIKDGSLLDERSLAEVATLAAAHDFQIWIERVDTSGLVGVVMEDGEIVGAVDESPTGE